MNERHILEMGIRATGVLFFFQSIAEGVSSIAVIFLDMGMSFVGVAVILSRLAVAVALIRYASALALRISEPYEEEDTTSSHWETWNRWVLVSAAATGVSITLIGTTFSTLSSLSYTLGRNAEANHIFTTITVIIVCKLMVIGVAFSLFLFQSQWFFGGSARER
jgi:hypothetical protein